MAVISPTTYQLPTSAPVAYPITNREDSLVGQQSLIKELNEVRKNESQFQNDIYLLSQFVRFGYGRAHDKVEMNPELLKHFVHKNLSNLGYTKTERDPNVWLNPLTKSEGWIIELSSDDGPCDGLWHGPFVVAGHFEGVVSRDLQRVIKRSKDEIQAEFLDVVKHCKGLCTDELVRLFQSPWFELRTEVKNPSDVPQFFAKHPELEPFLAAIFSFLQQPYQTLPS